MSKHWNASAAIFLLLVSIFASGAQAQIIVKDHNGPNLYVMGTPGDDVVFVWENNGQLMVTVNGKTTNVTERSGVTSETLYCVGANLYGGNDLISYQYLSKVAGGTITNGGPGSNEVVHDKGHHRGTNVDRWKPVGDVQVSEEASSAGTDSVKNLEPSTLDHPLVSPGSTNLPPQPAIKPHPSLSKPPRE